MQQRLLERTSLNFNFYSLIKNLTIRAYLSAFAVVSICTLICNLIFPFVNVSNLIMLYLLGVVIVATSSNEQYGPGIVTALLSTLAFDFFFIPPFFSFSVSDVQYFFTLVVMLVVSQTISHLTIRIQRHIEAIRKAKSQTETERFRNILLTSISHDMRTPLTIIMGSSGSLLNPEKLSTDICKELAKNIYDEAKRLNNIIVNILQIIRLESGAIALSKHMYSIEEIINTALERLKEEIINNPVNLYIAKNTPLILLDHILIEQVFMNLIENAIKYSPKNKSIEIVVRMSGKNVLIKITDQGKGIEENDLENIFNKFHRGNKRETDNIGFGLGLAICKHIVLAHGGKIWAENHRKGGAIFYFTLPSVGHKC